MVCVNKWSLCLKKYKSFVFVVFICTELQGDSRNTFLMDIIDKYKYTGTEMRINCLSFGGLCSWMDNHEWKLSSQWRRTKIQQRMEDSEWSYSLRGILTAVLVRTTPDRPLKRNIWNVTVVSVDLKRRHGTTNCSILTWHLKWPTLCCRQCHLKNTKKSFGCLLCVMTVLMTIYTDSSLSPALVYSQ